MSLQLAKSAGYSFCACMMTCTASDDLGSTTPELGRTTYFLGAAQGPERAWRERCCGLVSTLAHLFAHLVPPRASTPRRQRPHAPVVLILKATLFSALLLLMVMVLRSCLPRLNLNFKSEGAMSTSAISMERCALICRSDGRPADGGEARAHGWWWERWRHFEDCERARSRGRQRAQGELCACASSSWPPQRSLIWVARRTLRAPRRPRRAPTMLRNSALLHSTLQHAARPQQQRSLHCWPAGLGWGWGSTAGGHDRGRTAHSGTVAANTINSAALQWWSSINRTL